MFHVVLRVPDNPDRPGVTGLTNRLQQRDIEFTLTQRQDLLPALVTVPRHPVQIQAQQIRFEKLQQLGEVIDPPVSVVHVVNDADVPGVVVLPQVLADGGHVLRLA